MADKPQPRQRTRPKKGKPVEIPVPGRDAFVKNLKRVTRGRLDKRSPEQ